MDNLQLFRENLNKKYTISHPHKPLPLSGCEMFIHNCSFEDIPQDDQCMFSLTAIPVESGLHVRMKGVQVVPVTHTVFKSMPKWLYKLCLLLGAKS